MLASRASPNNLKLDTSGANDYMALSQNCDVFKDHDIVGRSLLHWPYISGRSA